MFNKDKKACFKHVRSKIRNGLCQTVKQGFGGVFMCQNWKRCFAKGNSKRRLCKVGHQLEADTCAEANHRDPYSLQFQIDPEANPHREATACWNLPIERSDGKAEKSRRWILEWKWMAKRLNGESWWINWIAVSVDNGTIRITSRGKEAKDETFDGFPV